LLVAGCSWLFVVLACSRSTVSKTEWQQMTHEDRVLYVQSLLGEEKAKDAKGGRGRTYDRSPEEYVIRIDQAYARGDAREAHQIFAELPR
jgi:hypothetical protein